MFLLMNYSPLIYNYCLYYSYLYPPITFNQSSDFSPIRIHKKAHLLTIFSFSFFWVKQFFLLHCKTCSVCLLLIINNYTIFPLFPNKRNKTCHSNATSHHCPRNQVGFQYNIQKFQFILHSRRHSHNVRLQMQVASRESYVKFSEWQNPIWTFFEAEPSGEIQ